MMPVVKYMKQSNCITVEFIFFLNTISLVIYKSIECTLYKNVASGEGLGFIPPPPPKL